jgi:protein tyrosine/serine phosphatase
MKTLFFTHVAIVLLIASSSVHAQDSIEAVSHLSWKDIFTRPGLRDDLPNFAMVRDGKILRGAQPTTAGFEKLKALGVKTVINLRDDSATQIQIESQVVTGLGMTFVSAPLSAVRRPRDSDMQRIDAILTNPDLQPVFVHCYFGADRTGLVVGLYRIFHERYDAAVAYEEMVEFGYKWWIIGLSRYFYDKTGYLPKRDPRLAVGF